jgi:hypothetical protein
MRSRRCSFLRSACALALLLAVLCFASALSTAMATDGDASSSKIAATLREAIAADSNGSLRADVMVQLESPQQALERACEDSADGGRAQRATCVADSLQQFADAAQEGVKALLAQHEGEFERAQFFWINNSVSVRKASGALIKQLAQLESVVEIRPEQIFHIQSGGQS